MEFFLIGIAVVSIALAAFFYIRNKQSEEENLAHEQELKKHVYELAILKEISERAGYSLDIHRVIDIIVGSLHQFIEYSIASYMLFDQDRLLFKADIERPVSKEFIHEVKERMVHSLSALLNQDLDPNKVEETITGSVMVEAAATPMRSYFNIPLIIGDKIVGILTVAHTKEGLYKEDEMTLLYKVVNQASQEVTRLEDVVKVEEKKLNAMVESMSEGIVMTDKEHRVVVVNPAARKALGLADPDISIFDVMEHLGPQFDLRGKLEESIKLDRLVTIPEVLVNDRTFQVLVSPVKSERPGKEKEVFGGVVILHDITHDKELDRMRDDFTSMMVHELRSPLDGIKKMGELMNKDDGIRQDKKTFLQYINLMHDSSGEMLELVNDLLDVAKIEAGKFEIRPTIGSIQETISDRVTFFQTTAHDANLKLVSRIAEHIPRNMHFDGRRITQVMNNLLANAIKFTPAGGTVSVDVILHKRGMNLKEELVQAGISWHLESDQDSLLRYPDAVVIGVNDSGVGIKKDDIPLLFNKFKQLEASARSGDEKKGTGLGLVISKGIVEAHGGEMHIASEEGKGSTFYFTIKLS